MAQVEPTLQENNTKLVIPPCPNPVSPEGMTVQPLDYYTSQDHHTWKTLVERQTGQLKGRVCDEFFTGLKALSFPLEHVPDIRVLSDELEAISGWRLVCVGGLVSSQTFFNCLARREFTVGWFVRTPQQMDYLPEPDLFHDLFGHVPLLTNGYYADFMQKIGLAGRDLMERFKSDPKKCDLMCNALLRLYWFTVEFGLMAPPGGDVRIYGAGIASSFTEVRHSLENPHVQRVLLNDIGRVVRTRYAIDEMQQLYFAIPSFKALFDIFDTPDLMDQIVAARSRPMHDKNKVFETDTTL